MGVGLVHCGLGNRIHSQCSRETLLSHDAAAHADMASFVSNASRDAFALKIALEVLEQIATTPRNRGAKRNAAAAVAFIQHVIFAAHAKLPGDAITTADALNTQEAPAE
jgi:hypothetical protein